MLCILVKMRRKSSISQLNHAEGVYIIRRKAVYHQGEALYIIKPQRYTLRVMIYAFGDDIHAGA